MILKALTHHKLRTYFWKKLIPKN